MKYSCICGYSVDDGSEFPEEIEYYSSGKRKGQEKSRKKVWKDIEPDKERFIRIEVEKDFSFVVETSDSWRSSKINVGLYACPKCHTVKVIM